MIFDQIIKGVVVVVGIAMSFSYYPQAWKIWKEKSSQSVSLLSFLILAVGTTVFLAYGLYINDIVLIAGFFFGTIGSWLVVLLTLYYRNRKGKEYTGP